MQWAESWSAIRGGDSVESTLRLGQTASTAGTWPVLRYWQDDGQEGKLRVQAGMVPHLVDAGLRRRKEEEQEERREEFSWVRNQGVKEEQEEQTPVVSIELEEG